MKFQFLIIFTLAITFISSKQNPRSKAFEEFIQVHSAALKNTNKDFSKRLISLNSLLPKRLNRFMQKSHFKKQDHEGGVLEEDIANRYAKDEPTPVYQAPLMTFSEMRFLLHELNLAKFDTSAHLASAAASYEDYSTQAQTVTNTHDSTELHQILDDAIENLNRVIKKSSQATLDALNLDSKLQLFDFMNFKFLDPETNTSEIETPRADWTALREYVSERKNEAMAIRQVLDQELSLLWDAKTLLFKRDNVRYEDQVELFGVTKQQASDNFDAAVQQFQSTATANVAQIQGYQILAQKDYEDQKRAFDDQYLKDAIEARAWAISEHLGSDKPQRLVTQVTK